MSNSNNTYKTEDNTKLFLNDTGLELFWNKILSKVDTELKKIYNINNNCINTRYEDLLNLKNNNKLIPGTKYRITDYETIIIGNDVESAGNFFDIILEAISINNFSENAKACQRNEDKYFSNSNLSAWEIKYCFSNDTTRFSWAPKKGKGVIYYMKDEFNNECPYDFKNIKFKYNDNSYYTFSTFDNIETKNIIDASLKNTCNNNIIKPYIYSNRLSLNKIFSIPISQTLTNAVIRFNTFSYDCNNIQISDVFQYNTFENNCNNIISNPGCFNNTFKNSCYNISLGNANQYNTFENNCKNITTIANIKNFYFGKNIDCTDYVFLPEFADRTYETKVCYNSKNEIKTYCEADLIN